MSTPEILSFQAVKTSSLAEFLATQRDIADGLRKDVISLLISLAERLDRIEQAQTLTIEKESYTVEEAAKRLGLSAWTVRQRCNKGQMEAKKVPGKGRQGEWRI